MPDRDKAQSILRDLKIEYIPNPDVRPLGAPRRRSPGRSPSERQIEELRQSDKRTLLQRAKVALPNVWRRECRHRDDTRDFLTTRRSRAAHRREADRLRAASVQALVAFVQTGHGRAYRTEASRACRVVVRVCSDCSEVWATQICPSCGRGTHEARGVVESSSTNVSVVVQGRRYVLSPWEAEGLEPYLRDEPSRRCTDDWDSLPASGLTQAAQVAALRLCAERIA